MPEDQGGAPGRRILVSTRWIASLANSREGKAAPQTGRDLAEKSARIADARRGRNGERMNPPHRATEQASAASRVPGSR